MTLTTTMMTYLFPDFGRYVMKSMESSLYREIGSCKGFNLRSLIATPLLWLHIQHKSYKHFLHKYLIYVFLVIFINIIGVHSLSMAWSFNLFVF